MNLSSDVSDRIAILVTSFGCWYILADRNVKNRGFWRQKRPKPSPTSQSCRQHISSPTSVTNIEVATLEMSTIFGSEWFILCEKIRKIANGKNVKSMTIPVLTKSSLKMKSEKFLSNAM